MASKKIQGITIEIDGNTTKLNDALKDTSSVISKTNSEIKDLNKALKFDPTNVELLNQKHDVLKRNIEATTEKLKTLKEAQRQMGDYNSLTEEQKENYRALSLEIAKSEKALKDMNTELKGTSKIDLSKLKDTLKKIGEIAAEVVKKMAQFAAVVGGVLVGAITKGVKSFAQLEKAQKGSQRLFEDSYKIVQENAAKAYESLGLSASEYYDQVNTYAVGLKNALNGDTKAAAELSNSILVAQADIVAATGADADAVSSAFAAVMRGNYTMLDNLRIGIKGSKEGMQEVIDKVNEWNKANGNATNYQMDNYADMQQALVDYVKMVEISGTAQEQMSKTITGSLTQVKATFDNFINGSGSPEQLASALTNFFTNVASAIQNLAPHILTGITTLLETLLPQITTLLFDLLPQLLNSITDMINSIFKKLSENTNELKNTITTLINSVVKFITENLPTIIEIGLILIMALAEGITNSLDTLIPALVDCITKIVDILTNPDTIQKLLTVSLFLILKLAEGLIKAIPDLVKAIPKIIKGINDGFTKFITETNWLQLGKNILKGILNGMLDFGTLVKDTIKKLGKKILGSIKSFFGIKSPSRLMRDEIGENLVAGIGAGFEEGIPSVIRDVNNAMTDLNNGVQASLNPTINPTANTNPLIIQIENFNNTRQQDVQALAEELEFYRKNSALARGGN